MNTQLRNDIYRKNTMPAITNRNDTIMVTSIPISCRMQEGMTKARRPETKHQITIEDQKQQHAQPTVSK